MLQLYDTSVVVDLNLNATFIVKIWIEENDFEIGKVWRGYITHVTSGNKKYIKNLDEIKIFLDQYIKSMGDEIESRSL